MKIVSTNIEVRRALVQEARQISVALPVLGPLLEQRKTSAFKRLLANYRDGKHMDQQNVISELFVIEGIINELNSKLENINLQE